MSAAPKRGGRAKLSAWFANNPGQRRTGVELIEKRASRTCEEGFWPLFTSERGGGENRTLEYSFCRAVPYHLATPPFVASSINYRSLRPASTSSRGPLFLLFYIFILIIGVIIGRG